ncbi:MAG: portal protein, partial [bacterium]
MERYNQYEQMDMDSEVNAALDIISEFSTQIDEDSNLPFDLHFKESPTDNEIKIIKEQLQQWVSLNELNKRIFKIFRNTIKYGDQVFIRDPETFKLFWVEMSKVTKIIVNESEGKEPEQY